MNRPQKMPDVVTVAPDELHMIAPDKDIKFMRTAARRLGSFAIEVLSVSNKEEALEAAQRFDELNAARIGKYGTLAFVSDEQRTIESQTNIMYTTRKSQSPVIISVKPEYQPPHNGDNALWDEIFDPLWCEVEKLKTDYKNDEEVQKEVNLIEFYTGHETGLFGQA